MQYGHRSNRMTNAGVFLGNDDFAREFHQLFFRINGIYEDPVYHEDVTIENTARALTGMQLDQIPGLYGTTRTADWWTSPIDFSNHVDAAGRQVRNTLRHHGADLEILRTTISGATAAQKLDLLASLAVLEQESLENLPLAIISYFADDNLTPTKIATIQNAWAGMVGQRNDLLQFLQDYAISTTFHAGDSYKYRNAFDRNMLIYNLNTVDNEESYRNSTTPRTAMMEQGGELFLPAHAVFGGQTSREAADSPDLFKEAYNSAVNTPNRIGKSAEACKDNTGARLWIWSTSRLHPYRIPRSTPGWPNSRQLNSR